MFPHRYFLCILCKKEAPCLVKAAGWVSGIEKTVKIEGGEVEIVSRDEAE